MFNVGSTEATEATVFRPGAEFPGVEEVFEINDFTVVTELEQFVVRIEAVLQEWQLSGGSSTTLEGGVKVRQLPIVLIIFWVFRRLISLVWKSSYITI